MKNKINLLILALCAASAVWGTTVTKTAKEIANGKWTSEKPYASAKLDDVITITVTPGTAENKNGVYYTGDYTDTHDWRMYQARANGQFTIKAAPGYIISSVTLTYGNKNTGVVSTSKKETDIATPETDQIISGTPYNFAAQELTFYVGNTTATTTSGQARIRSFSVTYEKGIYDDFRDPTTGELLNYTSATEKSVTTQCFTWTAHNCRFNNAEMDCLADNTPSNTMWKNNGSYLQTKAVEGGVKTIYFPWNQAKADESSKGTETVKVTVDTKNQSQSREGKAAASRGADSKFSFACNVKKNADVKIEIAAGNRITVGPITIVPYLRYTYTEMQEVKIGEGTFDCSLQINNTDGEGTITYSSGNDCVSFTNANSPIATLNSVGTAKITATWSEGASTSFTLTVIAKDIPEVKFASETVNVTDLYTTAPVTNALTVTDGAGDAAYTCDNPLVAKIVDNQVYVVGVGTATITATTEENLSYLSGSDSYTLNVAEPIGETIVSENFNGELPNKTDKYETTPVNFTDQDGLYAWTVNGHQYDGTWVRFATNANACMTSQGIQEGGIKRLAFTWKRANGSCTNLHTTIKALDKDGNDIVERSIQMAGQDKHTSNQVYNMRFEVKENAQFYFRNESDGFVVLISDMKIVPYLLYTQKSDELIILASEAEATYKNEAIINNTGATPTFTITASEPAGIATIDNDGTVTATASGTITVQAAWENVTTTYTLNITKNTLPEPVLTFADGDAVTKDMNVVGYANELTNTGDGEVSYSSSNEMVATVANNGTITIIGTGTTTITASSVKTSSYLAGEANYTLTVTEPTGEGAVTETFGKVATGSWVNENTTYSGDENNEGIYSWKLYHFRKTDNELRTGWNATNNYIAFVGEMEGGIKRVTLSFKPQEVNTLPANINIDNNIDGEGRILRQFHLDVDADNVKKMEYSTNLFIKKNSGFRLQVPITETKTSSDIWYYSVKITPYLLYTTKTAEATIPVDKELVKYTNEDLINNTGVTIEAGQTDIVFSIIGENNGVATIDAATGEVTGLKAGTVTIQAAWKNVTTTYMLTVTCKQDVTASFENATEKVTIGQSYTLQEMQLSAASDGDKSYTSSDNTVAEVEDGVLNIKKVGTVTITGTVDETTTYKSGAASYVLAILPNETDVISETYSNIPDAGVTHDRTDYKGNYDLTWYYRNGRSKSTDKMVSEDKAFWFCHVVTDKTEKYKSSYIETTFEGGIKAVYFDWKSASVSNNNNLIKMEIKADGTKVDEISVIGAQSHIDYDQPYSFSMEQKKSVKLTIANVCRDAADENDIEGKLALGPITIVPYLFYTTKSADLEIPADDESATYKNTALIDNRDNEVAISYSVSGGASVDDEGTVTVYAAGEYTVTATWGDVSTTYTLKVTKAEDPEPEPDFTLPNKTAGAISTICLSKKIASVENATLYSISHGNTSTIEFVEADLENDAAGMPYLVLVEANGNVNFYYGEGEAVTEPVDVVIAKGFVGSLSEGDIEIPSDGSAILISGGQLHIAGEWCVLTKNRAYIDSDNLPGSAAPVVGAPRRTIRLYNPDAAPTNLVESESESGKAMKVLRDGQFYIIRDTKTYNAQGILVE